MSPLAAFRLQAPAGWLLLVATFGLHPHADAAPVPASSEVPVGAFVDNPEYAIAKLSPDGVHVAFIAPFEERESLVVLRLADLTVLSRTALDTRSGILDLHWARNDRLLVEPSQDDTFRNTLAATGELVGIDIDGGRRELLYGYRAGEQQTGSHIRARDGAYASAEFLHPLDPRDAGDDVLIATRPWQLNGYTSVHRMDIYTGRLQSMGTAPNPGGHVIVDRHGNLAFSHGKNADRESELYRRTRDARWALVARSAANLELPFLPLRDSTDPNLWHVLDFTQPFARLALLDERTLDGDVASAATRPLHAHDGADVEEALFSGTHATLWGARLEPAYPEYFYQDPKAPIPSLHRALRQQLQADVRFTSFSADERKAIALVHSDRRAGQYVLVDFASREVRELFHQRPRLRNVVLAEVTPVQLRTRDGLQVIAYVTFPPGKPRSGLPLVVLPHGGPYGVRDRFGFDPEAQLLANRGYAVLQVNFRGSSGFGSNFENAGLREWGAKMQDDVTDATRWAIATGLADANRICIMGGSFGGYSALMGAVREPALYRCAIGYAGVYDLTLMHERGDIPRTHSGPAYLRMAIGDDPGELASRSPVQHATRIRAAVMLIHGGQDIRVPIVHARRMRAALEAAGKTVTWVEAQEEGHGFSNQARRRAMYEQVLAFLARHIGPLAATAPGAGVPDQ